MEFVAMLIPKVIKTKEEHESALAEIERLIDLTPRANTTEAEQLDLLAVLVKDYETKAFPLALPDPIDAIFFRMEQQNLAPRDLVPYIGSRSKVSEILTRQRPLTLSMIRSLHEGLGIPARVLLQEPACDLVSEDEPDWSRFPVREMIARGWIQDSLNAVQKFFSDAPSGIRGTVLLRKMRHVRSARNMDPFSLTAWLTRIIIRAHETPSLGSYNPRIINFEFMRELAKISSQKHGPIEARDFLARHGIPLVIEPHLPYTYLDGATIFVLKDRPVVGMSIRHDRLDNFWFTLMHEIAHVVLHSDQENSEFIDDLDLEAQDDPREREADDLAGEALIPKVAWLKSPASRLRSPDAALNLANHLGIHPAIVAGRVRHEWKAFRLLNNLVGHREVRGEFSEIKWPE
jgi:HTH-type transcriptional regulator/antitoxin HigA